MENTNPIVHGTMPDGTPVIHTTLYGGQEIDVVIQTEPQVAPGYPLPKDFDTIVHVCGGKQTVASDCCPGCFAPLDELESGETVHGCECGEELTATQCEEQSGHCQRCNWLLS